jgi:hypothetical protein
MKRNNRQRAWKKWNEWMLEEMNEFLWVCYKLGENENIYIICKLIKWKE